MSTGQGGNCAAAVVSRQEPGVRSFGVTAKSAIFGAPAFRILARSRPHVCVSLLPDFGRNAGEDAMAVRHSLKEYRRKRSFSRTPEPKGTIRRSAPQSDFRFVVQCHSASTQHYDVRLEVNGVLRSWAVPKGLPGSVGDKRLAVATEDHPLEYLDFQGTIPTGEYGAGAMSVWDRGTYVNLTDHDDEPIGVAAALEDGELSFRLEGKKTHGNFLLKRTAGNKWVLIRTRSPALS